MKIWPMFCKACGQGIDRGDKFCRNCGVNLPQEPIESAVAASAAAAPTGEPPMPVAFSTAELQRPLPIPKALLTEVASVTAVEEKPSPPATTTAAAAPPPISDAGKTAASDRDRPRGDAPAPVLEPKPEAAAATEKPAEAKSGGVESAPQKTAEAKPEAHLYARPVRIGEAGSILRKPGTTRADTAGSVFHEFSGTRAGKTRLSRAMCQPRNHLRSALLLSTFSPQALRSHRLHSPPFLKSKLKPLSRPR